ncbi:hypothetical protein BKA70DRAFT_1566966, partial [Coprinopsis sp. MPI-PUGE-AT-0042]
MSQHPASNVAVGTRRQSYGVAEHGAASLGSAAMFHSAHNLQIEGSTLSVAGHDVVHNQHFHYHSERPRNVWAILQLIPNFRKIYQDMISRATKGTGMWLLDGNKFRIWLE